MIRVIIIIGMVYGLNLMVCSVLEVAFPERSGLDFTISGRFVGPLIAISKRKHN